MLRVRERRRLLGFLTLAVGILMPALAGGAPLDDGLARLGRLEAERSRLLAEADSLGRLLAGLPPGDRSGNADRLLRRAEQLAERSGEIDLDLLLERRRCRSLAVRELDALAPDGSDRSAARQAWLLRLLEDRLGDGWSGDLVYVEPDSTDGYETLLDKQAYLRDLHDRIAGMETSLDRRLERTRREQALRRASEGFADESEFLDEGGRVGSDGTVLLRGVPAGGGGGQGSARPVGTGGDVLDSSRPSATRLSGDTEAAGSFNALDAARARLLEERRRVEAALEDTERLLDRYRTGR